MTEIINKEKFIDEAVSKLYNNLLEKVNEVYKIFQDFFGEDNVDLQGIISLVDFKKTFLTYTPNQLDSNFDTNIPFKDIPISVWDTFMTVSTTIAITSRISELIISNTNSSNFPFILIHFPTVRITNENDKFVDINNLWAKVIIDFRGHFRIFGLNRSEYPFNHFVSGYLHSHISGIPKNNYDTFQKPCTGTGPINTTMHSLSLGYDADLWNLFCLELSKFVTVESIEGTPYKYLERIGKENDSVNNTYNVVSLCPRILGLPSYRALFGKFVEYLIKSHCLKFGYYGNSYILGMSYKDFIITISNKFIEFYNTNPLNEKYKNLIIENVLVEGFVHNGNVYINENNISKSAINTINEANHIVCYFKEKPVILKIVDLPNNNNYSLFLNRNIALYILTIILRMINCKYGREEFEKGEFGEKTQFI